MSLTALQKRDEAGLLPASDKLESMLRMASELHKSGLLPSHIKSPQAAFAVIQKGLELGVPPMYSMSNIIVVQGKPTANAELMLALIYRDQGDNAIIFEESTAQKCTVAYKRRQWPAPRLYSFTIDDAKTAGLLSNQTWQKYPKAMLRARCVSAVARLAFPDSIGGMYTPEELGAQVAVTDEDEVTFIEAEHSPVKVLALPAQPEEVVEPIQTVAPVDGWLCGHDLQRTILDLETECQDGGIYKSVRDRLEVEFGTRNPATLSASDAERYKTYLTARLEKAKADAKY
jgi:hypothetical protein